MVLYASQSHSKYQQCLQRKHQKVSANEQKTKERKRVAYAITVLEAKQVKFEKKRSMKRN